MLGEQVHIEHVMSEESEEGNTMPEPLIIEAFEVRASFSRRFTVGDWWALPPHRRVPSPVPHASCAVSLTISLMFSSSPQHYAVLYIKYMQIFKKLEACYDSMVHPQKRIDIKMTLELVIRRVVELRHMLVKWNPPNPDVTVDAGDQVRCPMGDG